MADNTGQGRRSSAIARAIAWIIFIVWGAFWIFFNVASGFNELGDLGPMALVSHLVVPVVLVILMWICWRWEIWGGLLLILAGILAVYFFNIITPGYEPVSSLLRFFILVLPAFLVGMLLVLCGMQVMRAAREDREKEALPPGQTGQDD
jgi:hypothetical protein